MSLVPAGCGVVSQFRLFNDAKKFQNAKDPKKQELLARIHTVGPPKQLCLYKINVEGEGLVRPEVAASPQLCRCDLRGRRGTERAVISYKLRKL